MGPFRPRVHWPWNAVVDGSRCSHACHSHTTRPSVVVSWI
jgi:hypothetical protein